MCSSTCVLFEVKFVKYYAFYGGFSTLSEQEFQLDLTFFNRLPVSECVSGWTYNSWRIVGLGI
jgi:hypothetical protein